MSAHIRTCWPPAEAALEGLLLGGVGGGLLLDISEPPPPGGGGSPLEEEEEELMMREDEDEGRLEGAEGGGACAFKIRLSMVASSSASECFRG